MPMELCKRGAVCCCCCAAAAGVAAAERCCAGVASGILYRPKHFCQEECYSTL